MHQLNRRRITSNGRVIDRGTADLEQIAWVRQAQFLFSLRIISRRSNGLVASRDIAAQYPAGNTSALVTKIISCRALACLGVKLFDLAVLVPSLLDPVRENTGPLAVSTCSPAFGRDLLHRLVPAQSLKRHSSFELI